jgi:tetratricopeptide (TPR) repeat protein
MFKIFLPIIVITLSILIGINSCSLDNSSKNNNKKESIKSSETLVKQDIQPIESIDKKTEYSVKKSVIIEEDIYSKIESLFQKADELTTPNRYKEALNIYDEIIIKLEVKEDIELLKSFSKACFFKAYIFKNYFQENDKAIRAYNRVIEKFENSKKEELLTLYYNAQILKAYLVDDDKSIEIYDEIINKFKNFENIELLKKFASAQFAKSHLLKGEDRIEVYDEVIDRFKDSTEKKLLKELSTAQFAKAYMINDCFQNRQEAIEVYDEIIERFKPYEKSGFRQEVTDALFAKSFLLMGDYNQESMEIFDEIIDRCKSCQDGVITQDFEYSVINNIELALITNCDDTRYRDLAKEHLSQLEDTEPQLEMLSILRNAQDLNQDEAIERWKEQYKDFYFENWSFEELKKWNNRMEDSEQKERIKGYLDLFISHSMPLIKEVTAK